ncbi:cytochrome-c peroxidase [Methylobacterium sp. ID0610]|uniref:cytochrome-c peroxidase n=1 Tax=Methylobacterium carpenticola TaxID=3344827 RepID=UPI003691C66A
MRRAPLAAAACLCALGTALLLAGTAPVRAPDLPVPVADPAGAREPITPIPPPPAADPREVALGERLFADPRLSGDGARACTSCHDVHSNGADRQTRNPSHDAAKPPLNVSTVFNAALSYRLGWEGKTRTLEAQAREAIESPASMGARLDDVLARLRDDAGTVADFHAVFARAPDRDGLLRALATYERSLLTPDSRFDLWLRGDPTALSPEERAGYDLFRSLGCVSCHQGVNVGANLLQRHGIFHPLASPEPVVLRVPSLRNVAETPPYFHDGSAPTLREAVRRMALAQLNQRLADDEIDRIAAFLKTLTGRYRGRPVAPPPG